MLRRSLAVVAVLLVSAPLLSEQRAEAGSDWPEYGGTLAGQRYSPGRHLTPANVNQLQVAWTFHTHMFDTPSIGSNWRASFEATPVLWDGKLFFDTPFDAIFALDAATGKLAWTFDPKVNRDPQSWIYIVTSRGVALWHGKQPEEGACGSDRVFVATLDRRLIARDARTGEACVGFGEGGTVDLMKGVDVKTPIYYEFTSPPTVVGDTIVLGSTVGDNQAAFVASGAVRGFSAITGKQMWSWEPLPWTLGQHPRQSGSGNVWAPMAADAEHDLVFLPTGSASVDFFGGMRPGDNRDANSLVALQASTGRRVWGFQLVHHDLWDYDTPSEPVLFTFHRTTPAVAVTTKTSMVYVFNRLTGEPLYPIEERPVPKSTLEGEQAWATQPFSTLPPLTPLRFGPGDLTGGTEADRAYCREKIPGLEYEGMFTPPSKRGTLIYPGSVGGANWGSSAFDPKTGVLFTRVSSFPFVVRQVPRKAWPEWMMEVVWIRRFRSWYLRTMPEWMGGYPPAYDTIYRPPDSGGTELEASEQTGTPYLLSRTGLLSPRGVPCGPEPFGALVATNLQTGKQIFSVPHGVMVEGTKGSVGVGGPMVTGGGLLFAASTNDPFLRAYDSATGRELWRGALPVPANATPMSYRVGRRQFVVIADGGHGFVGQGHADAVIAFALPEATGPRDGVRGRGRRR